MNLFNNLKLKPKNLFQISNFKFQILVVLSLLLIVGSFAQQTYALISGRTSGGSASSGSLHNFRQPAAVTNGLVANYKFNGDATDSVANTPNTLTDNNTVTQATGPGGVGYAAQFTAANSEYLKITDNSTLRANNTNFEIGVWVYLTDKTTTDRYIISKMASGSDREYAVIYRQGTDRLAFYVTNTANSWDGTVTANNFGSPSLSTWYYVHAYYDSTNNQLGIQVNNGTFDTASYSAGVRGSTGGFELSGWGGSSNLFDGNIARVGFWKRTLTAAERTSLYNSGTGLYSRQLTDPMKQKLVSYWDLEEASGSRLDTYGQTLHSLNDGTATGGTYVEGKFGKAMQFNGTSDHVTSGTVTGTAAYSASFWIKTSAASGVPFSWSANRYCKIGAVTAHKLSCPVDGSDAGSATTTASIDDGNWHHIVIASAAGAQTIYMDGVSSGTATETLNTGNGTIDMGQITGGGTYFAGTLDDVRVYNRAITADEVATLYAGSAPTNKDQSIVGWWRMNDNAASTTVTDLSGQGNTGTAQQNTNLLATAGVFAGGLTFNGTSDYVTVAHNALLNPGTGTFTASAWVKNGVTISAEGDMNNIFSKGEYLAGDYKEYYLGQRGGTYNGAYFRLRDSVAAEDVKCNLVDKRTLLSDSNWHLVTAALDGPASGSRLYVDGQLCGSRASYTKNIDTTAVGYIGRYTSTRFSGSLDDIRIYNRALSAYEINEMYLSGRP